MGGITDILQSGEAIMRVRIRAVSGSSPREPGAELFVTASQMAGTIGGGQLEYLALDKARSMLRQAIPSAEMELSLGPEIGQCCGGRVGLAFHLMSRADIHASLQAMHNAQATAPHVYLIGAGHVGRALALLLQHMPVTAVLVDGRQAELDQSPAAIPKKLTALPEAVIRDAPSGSAFVVATHDHALDFMATAEALARRDAAYIGMIGSATKRAKFIRFLRETMPGQSPAKLVCPIGGGRSHDKRPEVIAAFTMAEIMAVLTQNPTKARGQMPKTTATIITCNPDEPEANIAATPPAWGQGS